MVTGCVDWQTPLEYLLWSSYEAYRSYPIGDNPCADMRSSLLPTLLAENFEDHDDGCNQKERAPILWFAMHQQLLSEFRHVLGRNFESVWFGGPQYDAMWSVEQIVLTGNALSMCRSLWHLDIHAATSLTCDDTA